MTATEVDPGAYVLEVASIGKELLTSLTKLIISRKVQERRMDNVLAAISFTTSYLTELGTQINRHAYAVRIEDSVTRPTCDRCKADFEKLLAITNESLVSGLWLREGTLGGTLVTAEVDPCFLFTVALGGREQSAEFWARLEATRTCISTLTDTVKFKIFKELKKQDRLTPEPAEELQNLTAVLPQLVKEVEKAQKLREERVKVETKLPELVEKDKLKDKQEICEKSIGMPNVGVKEVFEKPIIERRNSYAPSEVIVNGVVDNKSRGPLLVDDRRRSFDSFDSMDDSNFYGTKEVFEEWQLRWNGAKSEPRNSWSLFGIKIKEFYNIPGFWSTDPELRSDVELREAYEKSLANITPAKHRASIDKAMRKLPVQARESLEGLVEDRERRCNNVKFRRQWSIVAVRPRTKHHYGGEGFFNSAKSKDWLIMLKGETVDRTERKLPFRWGDPWRKPYKPYSGRREQEPVRYRGRGYVLDRRNWSPERQVRAYSPVRVNRSGRSRSPIIETRLDRRSHYLPNQPEIDGCLAGTIVVGAVPIPGEAERKMDEILEDLPGNFAT